MIGKTTSALLLLAALFAMSGLSGCGGGGGGGGGDGGSSKLADSLTLYDNFDTPGVDGQKWDGGEISRGITGNALELHAAVRNADRQGNFKGGWRSEMFPVSGSDSIQADVTVTEATRSNTSAQHFLRMLIRPIATFNTDLTDTLVFDVRILDTGSGLSKSTTYATK